MPVFALSVGIGAPAAPFDWHRVQGPLTTAEPSVAEFQGHHWVLGGEREGSPVDDIWSSANGESWTFHHNAHLPAPTSGAAEALFEGRLFLVPTEAESLGVWASEDGLRWEVVTPPGTLPDFDWVLATEHDGALWVLSSGAGEGATIEVRRSADGVEWELVTASAGFHTPKPSRLLSFDGELWLFAPHDHGGSPAMNSFALAWTSGDGLAWWESEVFLYEDDPDGREGSLHFTAEVHSGQLWAFSEQADGRLSIHSSGDGRHWALRTEVNWEAKARGLILRASDRELIALQASPELPNNVVHYRLEEVPASRYRHVYAAWIPSEFHLYDTGSFNGLLWYVGPEGFMTSRDSLHWTGHGGRHRFVPGLSAAVHNGGVFVTNREGTFFRILPQEDAGTYSVAQISTAATENRRTTLASHGGRLWRIGGWYDIEVPDHTVWPPWLPPPPTTRLHGTAGLLRHSSDGSTWVTANSSTALPANDPLAISFDGRLYALGGAYFEQDEVTPLHSIRALRDDANWEMVLENPPFAPAEYSRVLTDGKRVYLPVDRALWVSENMTDWDLLTDDYLPEGGEEGHLSFLRNRAWFLGRSGGVAGSWHTPPLAGEFVHNFSHDSSGWSLASRFDETEAGLSHDAAEGRVQVGLSRVDAPGYATLTGPDHEIVPHGEPGNRPDLVGILQGDSDAAGQHLLRMVVEEAVGQGPWVRLRANPGRHEMANTMDITNLGGGHALLGDDTPRRHSMILTVPPSSTTFQSHVDILGNPFSGAPGSFAMGGVRLSQWQPPHDGEFATVADYTFSGDAAGFTARTHATDLIAPVAAYHDERGLVVRGADVPRPEGIIFGWWGHESEIPIEGGALYRLTWTVGSDAPAGSEAEVPVFRLRLNETLFRYAPVLNVVSHGGTRIPTQGSPEQYVLWFEAPGDMEGGELIFSFDYLWVDEEVRRADREIWLESLRVDKHTP